MATIRKFTAGGTAPDGVQIGDTGEKVGFLGATPIVAATITALTDNSTGTADNTIAVVGSTNGGDVSGVINNNFADLAAKVNAVLTLLTNLGFRA